MFSPGIFEFVNKIEDCLECVKVSNRLSPRASRAAHSDYHQWDLTSENIKNKTDTDASMFFMSYLYKQFIAVHIVYCHYIVTFGKLIESKYYYKFMYLCYVCYHKEQRA